MSETFVALDLFRKLYWVGTIVPTVLLPNRDRMVRILAVRLCRVAGRRLRMDLYDKEVDIDTAERCDEGGNGDDAGDENDEESGEVLLSSETGGGEVSSTSLPILLRWTMK